MHARVAHANLEPQHVEKTIKAYRNDALPAIQKQPGFKPA